MGTALLIVRLLLAGVFALAAFSKLADRKGSRTAAVDFGVPERLAGAVAILLPLAELAVAAALLFPATAFWGAAGALGLLVLFVAGILFNLARGNRPDCRCFGQIHSAPAGWKTLARNGVFAAAAGFIIWRGGDDAGPSMLGWLGSLTVSQVAGIVFGLVVLGLLGLQGWTLANLLRQNGRLLTRLDAMEKQLIDRSLIEPAVEERPGSFDEQEAGLPMGSPAPDFNLPGLYGETRTLDSLRAPDKPVLLFFTAPECGPCAAMLPEIGRWQREHSDEMTIALISRGSVEENRAKTAEHGVERVLSQEDWEVAEAYEVDRTPSAVLVNADGTIGGALMEGRNGVSRFVERLAEGETPCPECGDFHAPATLESGPKAMEVGEIAPEIELPDLGGQTVKLSDFEGGETLVVFWSPNCGFCRQMLPDLKEWEADPPKEAPRLLLVSTGAVEANEAMGFDSPVALDEGFAAGHAYGARGTPSAVLVDAEGNVASDLAAGAQSVLALAKAESRKSLES
ncbi:MAG: MauE/DoxX family redox-associated membrane protein [Rubrobacteraceae bacterium]